MSDTVTISRNELDTIKAQLIEALHVIEALGTQSNDVHEEGKERARGSFFAKLDEMSKTANLSEEEAAKVAEEAVHWARTHKRKDRNSDLSV
jgi:hypothetical protein